MVLSIHLRFYDQNQPMDKDGRRLYYNFKRECKSHKLDHINLDLHSLEVEAMIGNVAKEESGTVISACC